MFIRRFFALVISLFLIFSPVYSAYAGLPQAVTSYAVTITNVVKTGVGASANFFFKKAANDPSFATPAATVTNRTMATGFLKRFAKFGAFAIGYAVIENLLDGTDWVMNPENNSITKPSVGGAVFCVPNTNNCFSSPQALVAHVYPPKSPVPNSYHNFDHKYVGVHDSRSLQEIIASIGTDQTKQVTFLVDYKGGLVDAEGNVKGAEPYQLGVYVDIKISNATDVEITPAQLGDLIQEKALASDLETLLSPQPDVAPAQDPAYNDLYAPPAADAVPDTNVDPNPDPNPDTGECPTGYIKDGNLCVQDPVTEPETPTNPEGLPVFCSWAKPVCDFIDWFKEDVPEDTPPKVVPYAEERDVGLDSVDRFEQRIDFTGQCPANVFSFSMMGVTYAKPIPYQHLCSFLEQVAPWLLAMCYLGSAYFVVENL